MAATQNDQEMHQWYVSGLASLIQAINSLEKSNQLDDPKKFAEMLNWSFTTFKLVASDLAIDEKISKAAISKWQNGHAMPSAPTRKTVINWIRHKLQDQLDQLTVPKIAKFS
jgi:hypothetical protein